MTGTIAFATDGACEILELVGPGQVQVAPVTVIHGDTLYVSGAPLPSDRFNVLLNTSAEPFRTAAPNVFEYSAAMERALAVAEQCVAITVSSDLSSAHRSALLAAQEMEGDAVRVIDSRACAGLQALVIERALGRSAGCPASQIQQGVAELVDAGTMLFVNVGLEYGLRQGRVTYSDATRANPAGKIPIVSLDGGRLVERSTTSTISEAVDDALSMFRTSCGAGRLDVLVSWSGDREIARSVGDRLAVELRAGSRIRLVGMTQGVQINIGPGSIGLAALPLEAWPA